jgi:hypothetical protein
LKRFPTERDVAIFRRLDIRRFSAFCNLHHFIGGDVTGLNQRMAQLYDGGYVGRIKEHLHHDTVHARHLVYCLTDKGRRVLIDQGIQPTYSSTSQYLHECLTSFVYDSFEIGAAESGLEFIGWDKLQHDERVHARHSKHPFAVKLPSAAYLRLDGSAFVLKSPDASKQDRCIPGCEIDRNTEPLRSYTLREKWSDKLKAHKEFVERRIYTKHFGFGNCLIPIITTNATHMLNIMRLAQETIGNVPWLLFKAVPDWPKARNFPKPNGEMISQPWRRVGHPDLSLSQ